MQKLKEFITTKPNLQDMLKRPCLKGKKKTISKNVKNYGIKIQ